MEPSLLVGDRLFVTNILTDIANILFLLVTIFKNRLMFSEPNRGDVVVFKTPSDNRTDSIKRLLDYLVTKFIYKLSLHINNNEIFKSRISKSDIIFCEIIL